MQPQRPSPFDLASMEPLENRRLLSGGSHSVHHPLTSDDGPAHEAHHRHRQRHGNGAATPVTATVANASDKHGG